MQSRDGSAARGTEAGRNAPAHPGFRRRGHAGDRQQRDGTYLRSNGDGTYVSVTEPIMTAVFGGADYTGTQLDAFTQAADDARAVISFVHDNPVPAE